MAGSGPASGVPSSQQTRCASNSHRTSHVLPTLLLGGGRPDAVATPPPELPGPQAPRGSPRPPRRRHFMRCFLSVTIRLQGSAELFPMRKCLETAAREVCAPRIGRSVPPFTRIPRGPPGCDRNSSRYHTGSRRLCSKAEAQRLALRSVPAPPRPRVPLHVTPPPRVPLRLACSSFHRCHGDAHASYLGAR